MNNDHHKPSSTAATYSRRPLWQWILIYAVVGGAVYGAIYAFLYKPGSNNSYGAKAPTSSHQATVASPASSPAAMAPVAAPAQQYQSSGMTNSQQTW